MQGDMAKEKIEPFLPGGMTESGAGAGNIQDEPRTSLNGEVLKRRTHKKKRGGRVSKGHRAQPKSF